MAIAYFKSRYLTVVSGVDEYASLLQLADIKTSLSRSTGLD
jgi:hypothetical protein